MALRFCDSFDHYATADMVFKWDQVGGSPTIAAGGRSGSRYNSSNWSNSVRKLVPAHATYIAGCAFQQGMVPSSSILFSFLDGTSTQVDLRLDTASRLYFTRNGTQIGALSTEAVPLQAWCYIEAKVTISGSVGVAAARINESVVLNGSGLNTQAFGANIDGFRLCGSNGLSTLLYVDDLYLCDGSGSINIDFLGDIKVDCLLPTGAGATTAWTPNTGANYAAVDEAASDSDTTYVSSSTVNQVDTYAMGNLTSSTGSIKGVQYLLLAKKDDAGARSIAPVIRPVSTDRVGATAALGDSYYYVREIAELNPDDSAAWDFADINGLEYGQKLIA